ncbi:hypothetical protein D3C79_1066110 [compost metagenome]
MSPTSNTMGLYKLITWSSPALMTVPTLRMKITMMVLVMPGRVTCSIFLKRVAPSIVAAS